MDSHFLIHASELTLRFTRPPGARRLSAANHGGDFETWRVECKAKLAELMGFLTPRPGNVTELRRTCHDGVEVRLLVMDLSGELALPAYLLRPQGAAGRGRPVMAIHGHGAGRGEGCLGLTASAYNGFAMELARAGHLVLLPIHRGFGPLRDLTAGLADIRLDYEQSMHFTCVTDAFVRGRTLVAENVEDLLRWEHWLAESVGATALAAAGLSYGGDLALCYGAFSERVERIFASGSCASFEDHFARCVNAPAHCIPGVLRWMDRSDIAGLNAPRPLALQFGELDTPCLAPGRENFSAARTARTEDLFREARRIYAAAGAADNITLTITPGMHHAMDVQALLAFLGGERP